MRYFAELSYNGAAYRGWQRQKNAPSVQQTLEDALSTLLGEKIEVTGAGRTDAGVHAACYVAHFDVVGGANMKNDWQNGDNVGGSEELSADFLYHANSILPPDIALRGIKSVADDAHARFDAKEREYTYCILPLKDPFRAGMAWHCTVPLDVEAMNMAAAHLLTVSDFTTFAKLHGGNKTNICRVIVAEWKITEILFLPPSAFPRQPAADTRASVGGVKHPFVCLTFTIRADRFLRNMVRAIVGTLVDVGRGKITPERFAEITDARDLSLASGGAPAHGLFLTDITY